MPAERCHSGDYCTHQQRADELADAPVVLVLHRDGRADLSVANGVVDEALATYLEQVAAMVRAGEHRNMCTLCEAGEVVHDHG